MRRKILSRLLGAVGIVFLSQPTVAQSLGNLAQYPPIPKILTVTTADDGMPMIEPAEIVFESGRYYRLTIECPDVRDDLRGWRIEMPSYCATHTCV